MKTLRTNKFYTPIQLKMPVDLEKKIEISDGVYSIQEVLQHIDLQRYFVYKGNGKGRPGYARINLLKIILFAFMEYGNPITRFIEKLCKTDIRFMGLSGDLPAPSHMTPKNFGVIRVNQELTSIHEEVIDNLNCIHGALLRVNRSIQAQGTFKTIKGNRGYKRASRRGPKMVLFEFSLICCGINLRKFHNNRTKQLLAA